MSTHAIIAARGGGVAKSRCGGALNLSQRGELILAMLADMIEVLSATGTIDHVHVVTPTPAIAQVALDAGARPVLESEARGINLAFDVVLADIRARDSTAVIMALPGDLPLIEAAEIEAALGLLVPGGAVIVPANADGGTGAVVFHADSPFVFRFGADSLRRHHAGAVAVGLKPVIAPLPSLGLDIDRPEDFDRVLRRRPGSRTARLLIGYQCCTEALK